MITPGFWMIMTFIITAMGAIFAYLDDDNIGQLAYRIGILMMLSMGILYIDSLIV